MCFQRPDKSIIRQWSWHELSDSARHDAGTLPIRSVSAGNLNWNRNIKTKKEIRLIFHHVPTFQSSCCGWAPSSFSGKSIKNKSLSTVGHTILHNALQIITRIKSIQPFDCSIGHMHRMMLEAGTTSFIQNQIALGIRSWVVTYINVQFFVYIHLLTRQQGVHLTLKRTNKQRLHHEKPLMVQLPWPRLKLHVPASTCNLEYFSTFC